ncbi:MAG TPA: GntR family transcriptional regulator [Ktedonobacterales bacterium]|nr:GntR family transcriptional regulator [Ktedonobacterales bacterium]
MADVNHEPALIRLNEESAAPKYMQIAEQVREFVATGQLLPGDQLPSVRQLASDLGVNVNTVLAAYRALEAEEIVLVRHGSRAVVHPRFKRPARPGPGDVAEVRSLLWRVRTEALLRGMTLEALQALARDVFSE